MTVEAQLKCECGARDLVVTGPGRRVGEQLEVKMPCTECESRQRTVTIVYDPDEYDLVDPYGDGVTLRARCIDCGATYYGPIEACYECDSTRFNRFLGGEEDADE